MAEANKTIYRQALRAFDGKSSEERIRELIDREQIRDLINTYSTCAGLGDGETMAELFVESGGMSANFPNGSGPDYTIDLRSRDELVATYNTLEWGGTMPTIHNIMINVKGDSAKGIC